MGALRALATALAIHLLAAAAAASEVDAASLYAVRCSMCHGDNGQGDGIAGGALQPPPTDLSSADYWRTRTREQVRRAIAEGIPGSPMVPFGGALSAAEIDALVEHVRAFAGSAAGDAPVSELSEPRAPAEADAPR